MALRFYNTLTKKVEEFKPQKKGKVSMYTCGPTVYNYVHIGNLRAMMSYDIVKKYLRYRGYEVTHVMNITDVDDKTIRDSIKEKKSLKEFTKYYTDAFFDDLCSLNIEKADIIPKATEEIEVMADMIRRLLDNGYAYKTDSGDIYFKISAMDDYGKLANLDRTRLKENAGGRLDNSDEYEKENARDFALWKGWDKLDGENYWETEIGKGRPGWHIECSAMSYKYLGLPIDIHMGGVDLIFPHHTNEIAQTEAAYNKKFVNYWLHNEHLIVNGEKMSKSLGNFYTLRDLKEKGYDYRSIRYELLSAHYRQRLDFREEDLKKVPDILKRYDELFDKLDHIKEDNPSDNAKEYDIAVGKASDMGSDKANELLEQVRKDFEDQMDNDINITGAIGKINSFITSINKIIDELSTDQADKIKECLLGFDNVLGFMHKPKEEVPSEVVDLAKERQKARDAKDWQRADRLRDEIKEKGYQVNDEKSGFRITRI